MGVGESGLLIGGIAALVDAAADSGYKGLGTADACTYMCQFPDLVSMISSLRGSNAGATRQSRTDMLGRGCKTRAGRQ